MDFNCFSYQLVEEEKSCVFLFFQFFAGNRFILEIPLSFTAMRVVLVKVKGQVCAASSQAEVAMVTYKWRYPWAISACLDSL